MNTDKYLDIRDRHVRKSNELIQKSRFKLSLQQQKMILYLISQIESQDDDFKLYRFSIPEFCRVCGIDADNGKNYINLKRAIKDTADKSIWIRLADGRETLLRWVEKPYIDAGSGTINIRLDADMKPFLLQLKRNYTQYELIYTLHFKSKYTIRLYELLASVHYHETEKYERSFELDELRRLLDAETYTAYKNFRARVLVPAVTEINEYSDKDVSFDQIKQGKKVVGIKFTMCIKDYAKRDQIRARIDEEMGGNQMYLWADSKKGDLRE